MPFSVSVGSQAILGGPRKLREGTQASDSLQRLGSRTNLHVKHEEKTLSHSQSYIYVCVCLRVLLCVVFFLGGRE